MNSKNISKYSIHFAIYLNVIVIIVYLGFIYSANRIIKTNNKIQINTYQNRYQSRLYLKTISNLKQSVIHLKDYKLTHQKSDLELAEDQILAAKGDFNILNSEFALNSEVKNLEGKSREFELVINQFEFLFKEKSFDGKKLNFVITSVDQLIKSLYEHESSIWEVESERFNQLAKLRDQNKNTFYYLAFMFGIFVLILVFFSYVRFKLMNKIASQNEQLIIQASMSTLGVMSAELAHEINSPLMVIDGRLKHMNNELNNQNINIENLKRNFDIIQRNSKRIQTIVKNFKFLSKDGKKDKMEPIHVSELANELNEIIISRAEHYQIAIKLIIRHQELLITLNKVQILQVLVNLVNNSIDAIKRNEDKNKWIQIETSIDGNFLKVSVMDSGHGIPKEIIDKLYDPFFTTKNSNEGTGLGLSISKRIAREHKGDLIYNQNAQHTQFILELPIKRPA